MCNNIIEVIPRLFKKMNRIVAEYRHKDQLRELQEIKQKEQKNKEEEERLRLLRIELAYNTCPDKQLSKNHKVYIFSSPEYLGKTIPMVKVGITDDLPKRLKQHQTGCPTGRIYYEVDTYDSKGAEQALLNMYRSYGLAIKDKSSAAEEWIRISSLERTKERLMLVAEHRNGEYEDLSDECQLIRQMIVGEEEPFIVDGQNYIEYKEPPAVAAAAAEPEIPIKQFVKKICEKIGINDNKTITYKTALLNTIRDIKNQEEFKTHKSKLPIDIDTFLEMNIDGISLKKEIKGKQVKITVEMTQS